MRGRGTARRERAQSLRSRAERGLGGGELCAEGGGLALDASVNARRHLLGYDRRHRLVFLHLRARLGEIHLGECSGHLARRLRLDERTF